MEIVHFLGRAKTLAAVNKQAKVNYMYLFHELPLCLKYNNGSSIYGRPME